MKKNTLKKLLILALLIAAVVAFLALDLGQYMTLSFFKQSQADFSRYYLNNKIEVISIYMAAYVVITALSLPGATIMSVAAGALFGLVVGTIAVSFASTMGATLACLVSRFMLQDWVQKRFGQKLEPINEGIKKDGAYYLFTLRLIPVFPFFVINLVMGLTKMPLLTFAWVSQLGMLPATLVFVNAGKEIAKLSTLGGILSPSLLASFALLGLLPITAKKLLGIYDKHRSAKT